jgi:hypothetical protein
MSTTLVLILSTLKRKKAVATNPTTTTIGTIVGVNYLNMSYLLNYNQYILQSTVCWKLTLPMPPDSLYKIALLG